MQEAINTGVISMVSRNKRGLFTPGCPQCGNMLRNFERLEPQGGNRCSIISVNECPRCGWMHAEVSGHCKMKDGQA